MMNKKHCSPRHFQPLDGGHQSTTPWGAKRWILVGCWSCCCVLLVLLLMTEMQSLPGVYKGTRETEVYQEHYNGLSSSSSPNSSIGNSTASGSSSEPVNLDVLWEAVPFTPAIKHASLGHLEYSHISIYEQQQQQQDHQLAKLMQKPVTAAAAAAALPVSPASQQALRTPLLQPELSNPDNMDIAFMARLVAEAADAGITADDARAGYEQAFAEVAAPAGSVWHLRKPSTFSSWQQRTQKGAEYEEAETDSSSDGRESASAPGTSDITVSAAGKPQRSLQATTAALQLMTHALQLLKTVASWQTVAQRMTVFRHCCSSQTQLVVVGCCWQLHCSRVRKQCPTWRCSWC
ncbi:hypothetical protein COO60DRAFT_812784 [Scenedesmus sp. NREL 46B-D3]|nr:hypothetical protein COO60DRAFT_812784 [Scenedesmus sp. NREL 46B-D3]